MASLRHKECPSCGAPLDVPKGVTEVKCPYCAARVGVEWTRAAPPPASQKPQTVYVSPGLPRAAVVGIVLGGLLPAAVPLFIFLGPVVESKLSSHLVTFPAVCAMNQELEIAGHTFTGSGTLVTLELNCKLRIKDSKLTGDVVVLGKTNSDVVIENSTLEGKQAAIRLETNGTLRASKGTALKSPDTAIVGGTNTKLHLEDARVTGESRGVAGDVNTEVHALRSEIVGGDVALALSTSGKFFGESSTVKSNGVAVEAGSNLRIAAIGATLEAGDVAVRAEGSADVKLSKKSRVSGQATGILAGNNLELTVDDSLVEGNDSGVEAASNPRVRLVREGRVRGGRIALNGGENLELVLDRGRVDSEATALCGKYNLRITARHSSISGMTALHAVRKPQLELVDSTFSGAQVFDNRGCREVGATAPVTGSAGRAPSAARGALLPGVPVKRPLSPSQTAPPAAPPFDSQAAAAALDAAQRAAAAQCRSSSGRPAKIFVTPGFSPDGQNRGAVVDGKHQGTTEAGCIERIFRNVRIPPFDPATRPSGLMRAVDVK